MDTGIRFWSSIPLWLLRTMSTWLRYSKNARWTSQAINSPSTLANFFKCFGSPKIQLECRNVYSFNDSRRIRLSGELTKESGDQDSWDEQGFPLSSVSFGWNCTPDAIPELLYTLNFYGLQTLILWHCSNMFTLLEALTNPDWLIKITMLELVADPLDYNSPFVDCHNALRILLESFQGLADLHLMSHAPTRVLLQGIDHKATLKRLVIHKRDFG